MNHFVSQILARMTEDDKRQLADIWEPTVVSEIDANAWLGLTVMRDGRIRHYGDYHRKSIFDRGGVYCYRESCDGGLSWKKHIMPDNGALGASVYVPFLDRYVAVFQKPFSTVPTPEQGTWVRFGIDPDDTNPRVVKVSDDTCIEYMPPVVMRSRNRILFVGLERRPKVHQSCFYPVLFLSDDGESWQVQHMEECPYFPVKWPDQGGRWQQNNRENTITELSDGSLLMMTRTAMNYHYQTISRDGGETWEPFTQSVFHSSGTMPRLETLSDGRVVFLWCNTKMLPELPTADGIWEDYFTNRDVNHCAISEDDGRTWKGFREMFLNPIRYSPDFRANGGPTEGDKSVHQFECIELPMNKLLVVFGQHEPSRRIILFDLGWLYESKRKETLLEGFKYLSTQNYVKSIAGGFKVAPSHPLDRVGHCAFNRTSVTLLMPSPENNGTEALHITRSADERLVSGIGGAVWNFPAHRKGVVTVRAHIPGKGLRVSLLDYWMNPSDATAEYFANYSVVLRGDMQRGELFSEFVLDYDLDRGTVILTNGDYLHYEKKIEGEAPNGLCYLHMQSAATEADPVGAYVSGMKFEGKN
ncbi:MAG: exo-alpha-sialidase [Clostridia bacterium]|nr:exo-alpha-sialidase [Clostridia bacterium]